MKKVLSIQFLLVVCLPLAASFYAVLMVSSERMNAILEKQTLQNVTIVSNILENEIQEASLKARIISQLPDVRELVANNNKIELISRFDTARHDLGLNSIQAAVEAYDTSGNLLAAEPSKKILFDKRIIVKALEGTVSLNRKLTKDGLIIRATVPVYHETSPSPVGAISVVFKPSGQIAQSIRRISSSEIVFAGKKDSAMNFYHSTLQLNNEPYFPCFVLSENGLESFYSSEIGSYHFGRLVQNVENGLFVVFVGVNASEFIQMNHLLRLRLLGIALGAILFALIIALCLSKRILVPINQLVTAAKEFGAGNFEKPVLLDSKDEFATLGNTFESMRVKIGTILQELRQTNTVLDRKVFDLSVRNMINQTIINKNDDTVFAEMLQTITRIMDTQRASIMLLDPQNRTLSMKVTSSNQSQSENSSVPNISFALGEGIAGSVAKTRKTVMTNNPTDESIFKSYGDLRLDSEFKNLLTVPLIAGDELLGVINLTNKKTNFLEEDQFLVEDIADQIAIAIQKTRLYELAITDGLTGLFIKRYFMLRLDSEIARAKRNNQSLSLLIFDIDHFKKFNDTYGHPLGDRVIKTVADITKNSLRGEIDIAARYGGEEFAVILPQTNIDGAKMTAERIRKSVEIASIAHKNELLKVTISVGGTCYLEETDNSEVLIERADKALYTSKNAGRNCSTLV